MNATTEFNIEALPVIVTYVACVPSKWNDEQKTMVDQWRVEIRSASGFHSFDYFTGMGCRSPIPKMYLAINPPARWSLAYESLEREHRKPVKPKVADVLYSLFMDAMAADDNFHDWCENFGYSSDSIKAMNTYKQCLEIAVALRKHFDPATRAAIQSVIEEM